MAGNGRVCLSLSLFPSRVRTVNSSTSTVLLAGLGLTGAANEDVPRAAAEEEACAASLGSERPNWKSRSVVTCFVLSSFRCVSVTYSATRLGNHSLRIWPVEMGTYEPGRYMEAMLVRVPACASLLLDMCVYVYVPLRPKVWTSLSRRTVTVPELLTIFFLPRICCWKVLLLGRHCHSWRPSLVKRRAHEVHWGSSEGRNGADIVGGVCICGYLYA